MKTIYLFRHSKPDKNSNLKNEFIPLSNEGIKLIKDLFDKLSIKVPAKVYSSPYVRALKTAEAISSNVITDIRLIERKIGNRDLFTENLWAKQYVDNNAKDVNGESFKIVANRMTEVINEILAKMSDKESVIIVSHAAAICAYLQQYCDIKVTNVKTKCRKIVFNNKIILDGKINPPSCFILTFEKELLSISYID